nr:hypothetical protein [Tanacetum cinerariifolium]
MANELLPFLIDNVLCFQLTYLSVLTVVRSGTTGESSIANTTGIVTIVSLYGPSKMHFLKALPFGLVSMYLKKHIEEAHAAHNMISGLHYPLLKDKLGFLIFDELVDVFDVHALQMAVVGNMLTNDSRFLSQGHAKLKNSLVSLKSKKSLFEHEMSNLKDRLAKVQRNQDVEGSQVVKDLRSKNAQILEEVLMLRSVAASANKGVSGFKLVVVGEDIPGQSANVVGEGSKRKCSIMESLKEEDTLVKMVSKKKKLEALRRMSARGSVSPPLTIVPKGVSGFKLVVVGEDIPGQSANVVGEGSKRKCSIMESLKEEDTLVKMVSKKKKLEALRRMSARGSVSPPLTIVPKDIEEAHAAHNMISGLHYPLLKDKLGFLIFDELVDVFDVHALQMAVVGNMLTNDSRFLSQGHAKLKNSLEFEHFAEECKKPKRVKDYTYHKEKMLMCKQAEKGVSLQAEKADWLEDTDEEIDEQELEEHYSYMAKIQKVPIADSGTDTEPLEQTELEKYMTLNDHTVDYDKLE